MDETPRAHGFDAGTYGRSFADVYDRWYPSDPDTAAAVERVGSLAERFAATRTAATGSADTAPSDTASHDTAPSDTACGRILELGVGTGRLALPLAERGLEVVGMDSSEEMLDLLATKAGSSGSTRVRPVLGDAAELADWPEGPFDVVVAAFNLVFNLAEVGAQARLFDAAATAIGASGGLLVEAFLPAPLDMTHRRLEVRGVEVDSVVLIATDTSHGDGLVVGQHIELHDGEPVRLRPWRIRTATPEQLDGWAAAAGLELAERHADWAGRVFDPHGTAHVSLYRAARPLSPS